MSLPVKSAATIRDDGLRTLKNALVARRVSAIKTRRHIAFPQIFARTALLAMTCSFVPSVSNLERSTTRNDRQSGSIAVVPVWIGVEWVGAGGVN